MPGGGAGLRRALGYRSLFALSFGSIVGSGWLVLSGTWLTAAAPGGAITGFVAGGLVMMLIAACYAELSARMPETGGEFIYALRIFGPRAAFATGWFVLLYFLCVVTFEGLALAWIIQFLHPASPSASLYQFLGEPVTVMAVVFGVAGALGLGVLNYRGIGNVARFQNVLTYGFLAVACCVLVYAATRGDLDNLTPAFGSVSGAPWWQGSAWIFANCAFMLNGFQAIPMVIEEKAPFVTLRRSSLIVIATVGCGALFYCFVVAATAIAYPWQSLGPGIAINTVLRAVPGGEIPATLILLAGAVSLIKTWNSFMLMASRMLMSMARAGLFPVAFARINSAYGVPGRAVIAVVVINASGVFLGRGAIVPLINMCSMMLTLAFIMCCAGLIRLRTEQQDQPAFQVPGGTPVAVLSTAGAAVMAATAFASPVIEARFPIEWVLISIWTVLGLIVWKLYSKAGYRNSIQATSDTVTAQ